MIYLFGSYAWGNPDDESDLDLLVIMKASDEKKSHTLLCSLFHTTNG